MKPILFLDVDGPLNPYAEKSWRRPEGYTTHRFNPHMADGRRWLENHKEPLRIWLNPSHGAKLLELGYDLVWATTWEGDANVMIGPVLGLPGLPYVHFSRKYEPFPDDPDRIVRDESPGPMGTFFKSKHLVSWADGKPFVWADDEVTDIDTSWIRSQTDGRGRTYRVDPRLGLRDSDFKKLANIRKEIAA